jgi:hypothetical protein
LFCNILCSRLDVMRLILETLSSWVQVSSDNERDAVGDEHLRRLAAHAQRSLYSRPLQAASAHVVAGLLAVGKFEPISSIL